MKFLILGESGQVATELRRRAGDVALEIRGRSKADFRDPEACARLVRDTDARAVINAAGYTAVDRAEAEEALATLINAEAPAAMAQAAAARGLPFVQISTDYVFNGVGDMPFSVDTPTDPLGAYGRSKLAGERGVREAQGPHAILRTSWVFSSHGGNFVKTMLRLGAEREELTIVADQTGGPTPAAAIADACLEVARALIAAPEKTGTYHFSGTPEVTWADFAREIFRQAGLATRVRDIPSADYPTPARRPGNSRLDNSLIEITFGIARPDWRAGLADTISELGALTS